MAWWDDIRDMLKQELGSRSAPGNDALAAPKPLRQAQVLLQQTARELADARAHADVVRRRLGRAQLKLEALTRAPQPHPRYRERLVELARAIARDSDLAGSFQSHLAQPGSAARPGQSAVARTRPRLVDGARRQRNWPSDPGGVSVAASATR